MNIQELYEPLEQKSRRGRGGDYNYVPWQDVADRMNKVFSGNWSSEVMSQEIVGNNVIVRVRVTAVDPDTSTVCRAASSRVVLPQRETWEPPAGVATPFALAVRRTRDVAG